jgi:hypothetical protein
VFAATALVTKCVKCAAVENPDSLGLADSADSQPPFLRLTIRPIKRILLFLTRRHVVAELESLYRIS